LTALPPLPARRRLLAVTSQGFHHPKPAFFCISRLRKKSESRRIDKERWDPIAIARSNPQMRESSKSEIRNWSVSDFEFLIF